MDKGVKAELSEKCIRDDYARCQRMLSEVGVDILHPTRMTLDLGEKAEPGEQCQDNALLSERLQWYMT
jgi:hypothetical protein